MFYFWGIIYSYLPCFYVLFSASEEFYLQELFDILQQICPFKVHFFPYLTELQQVVCPIEFEKFSTYIGGPIFSPPNHLH